MNRLVPPTFRSRRERGQEIVELALVAPLLVLLLAGGIEFGRALYTYNILAKSVRNTARFLSASQMSLTGTIPAGYVTKAKTLALYGNLSGTGSKIVPDLAANQISVTASGASPYYVTVTANYPYSPVFSFLLPGVTFHPSETMIFVGYLAGPGT
jgi:Flp pilus assembly protein TadG